MDHGSVEQFIQRWKASGAAERANYALFLSKLCDLLGAPRPEPKQHVALAADRVPWGGRLTVHQADNRKSEGPGQ